jgi:Arc/MetJ-type ribon-helix-helix transcriptional regulator
MKIITVNLPESYIKAIDNLIGEKAVYPSRSELVRVAVREFLIKELESVNSFSQLQNKIVKQSSVEDKSEMFIQIPVDSNAISQDISDKQYKTYRIIKK